MPATTITLLGTVGIHGIAADETGMIVESIDDTTKKKSNDLRNRVGNRQGRADYDHSIEISIKGKITAATGYAQKVSAEIVLGNAITADHLPASLPTGKTLIDEVKRSRGAEDWQGVEVSAEMLPFFG